MTHQYLANERNLLDELIASVEADRPVALITVVKAKGRFAPVLGQRMLIWPDKDSTGSPTLGQLEPEVLADAHQALADRRSRLFSYEEQDGSVEVFVEVLRRSPTLIIVGAGHVALPLAQLGKLIDFEVVVLDDRPHFANQQRFPMANQVLAQPLAETLRHWTINSDTYLVLVTRGHTHDVECLLEVIDSPARYIGMIGSKRRVKAVFDLLTREKDLDPAKFDRVYAPIGLDIGAESPAEIAISIIAEIINVYRGGRATSLAHALRADRRLPLHPARVEQKGS
ncbi:MAG: XdhC family protein [Anaerolineae bacterium]|nr:XdhC family protein [Anaerolineae bacterium]